MTSRSTATYLQRAADHSNPLVQQLFRIAEAKKTNVIVSADLTTTKELLDLADRLGPYIAVFKTHIDIVSDFGPLTVNGLKSLALKHNFLIFEDRKFVDIGNTVQKQYHGGALMISEWAHFVNASILAGSGIIEALGNIGASSEVTAMGSRGLLILAEMTTKGSLAVGDYTKQSVAIARQNTGFVVGFVAMSSLGHIDADERIPGEDFVIFTTGVNRSVKGDALGQQYNTPSRAVREGSDFIISGRGIYAAEDPVAEVKQYQHEAWQAYLERTGQ